MNELAFGMRYIGPSGIQKASLTLFDSPFDLFVVARVGKEEFSRQDGKLEREKERKTFSFWVRMVNQRIQRTKGFGAYKVVAHAVDINHFVQRCIHILLGRAPLCYQTS